MRTTLLRAVLAAALFVLPSSGPPLAAAPPPAAADCGCGCYPCRGQCGKCPRPAPVAEGGPLAEAFVPTGPVHDGTRAAADLPAERHVRNTGGSDGPRGPGSGSGLCVFTSFQMSADWHGVDFLAGFQAWMTRRPGGGYPDKLDQMVAAFCREKGVPVPPYVQHEGGDEAFLDLAIRTRRLLFVTYAGNDDFYRGGIDHMVNLAHLDESRAAIIDNNRPGKFVWMTRVEFLQRWKARGGGWAGCFLLPPPPPYAEKPATLFGQCPGGRCGGGFAPPVYSPVPAPEVPDDADAPFRWDAARFDADGPYWFLRRGEKVTGWYGRDGFHKATRPGFYATDPSPAPVPPPADAATQTGQSIPAGGVVAERLNCGKWKYTKNGRPIERAEALGEVGADDVLRDDRDRYAVAFVGDAAYLKTAKAAWGRLPADTAAKFAPSYYLPDRWQVRQFKLPAGLSVRKPVSPDGTGVQVAAEPRDDLTDDLLLAILNEILNPKPKLPAPPPVVPPPPADPKNPLAPVPVCPDSPGKCPLRQSMPWLVVAALAAWRLRNPVIPQPAPEPAK